MASPSVLLLCILMVAKGFSYHLNATSEEICEKEVSCSANKTCVYKEDGYNISACNPLFRCGDSSTCQCPSHLNGIITCDSRQQVVFLQACYCVTYDNTTNDLIIGKCLEPCFEDPDTPPYDGIHYSINTTPSPKLNHLMCKEYSRDGVMCGRCAPNSYPLAYSYIPRCISCPGTYGKLWMYILVAYGPLTVFYLIILFCRVNVTSSYLHGYVLFSQFITMPAIIHATLSVTSHNRLLHSCAKLLSSIFGIWNLDFFRAYCNEVCLKMDQMTIIALDYLVAVYPFILSIGSYALIVLYSRKIRCFIAIWRPCKYILALFDSKLDSRTSVIDAYATFFFLSYSKFLNVSFNLLVPVRLHHVYSNTTSLALYYNGEWKYFGKEHLLYGILGLLVFTIFNILPIVFILLYQVRWFQHILSKLPLRLDIIHTFMDLIQGCYKNGMEPGMRDLRWFSASFLIIRLLAYVSFILTLEDTIFYVLAAALCIIHVNLLVTLQPYRKEYSHYTNINAVFMLLLGILFISAAGVSTATIVQKDYYVTFFYYLSFVLGLLPLVFMCVYTGYWLVHHCRVGISSVRENKKL